VFWEILDGDMLKSHTLCLYQDFWQNRDTSAYEIYHVIPQLGCEQMQALVCLAKTYSTICNLLPLIKLLLSCFAAD